MAIGAHAYRKTIERRAAASSVRQEDKTRAERRKRNKTKQNKTNVTLEKDKFVMRERGQGKNVPVHAGLASSIHHAVEEAKSASSDMTIHTYIHTVLRPR